MYAANSKLATRSKLLRGLLASTLLLQMGGATYAAETADTTYGDNVAVAETSAATDILSKDNLPDLPPKDETAWLHSLNPELTDAEPNTVDQIASESSESGTVAAVMPTPMANNANGVPEGERIADVSGRITANADEAPSVIEDLTRKILIKEIELEKFNLNYKLNSAKQGRWKGERYAMFNEINAGMGLTGSIISLWNRGTHLHKSSGVKTYVQEDANIIPMIGAIIGAGAAVLEFGINEYHEYEASTKGFSPAKARDHVNSLKGEINQMLSEREQLIKLEESAPLLTGRVEVDNVEGRVLTDLRDQSLLEYQRFHIGSRKLLAFQQCQYFFDFTKNVTNAIGYDFAFLALHRHRRPWNGRAGVLFDVSGALTIAGPILSRVYAKGMGEYHRHYTHDTIKEAEAKEVAKLEADKTALDTAIHSGKYNADVTGRIVDRFSLYGDQSKMFQDELAKASSERNKSKLVASQNVGAGIFIGGNKLASGILFNACGFPQLYNKGKDSQTSTRVTNHLLFAASVTGAVGSGFAMGDTLRIQVQGEINRHKLASKGELPGQLVQKRLTQLDAMQARLQAGH